MFAAAALSATAYKEDAASRRALLAVKADPNTAGPSGQTALMFTSLGGQVEVVTLPFADCADRNAKDKAPNTARSLAGGQGRTRW